MIPRRMIPRRYDELDDYIFTCPICHNEQQFVHDESIGIYVIRYIPKKNGCTTYVYETSEHSWRKMFLLDGIIALNEKQIEIRLLLQ